MRSLPTVSVIVPVRNEERSLASCLDAILNQTYPAERIEVLVVDGGSGDGSRSVAASRAERDPRVRLVDNPSGSIPAGLNAGLRASTGQVIARVDARTRLAPDYLAHAVALLQETGASNVGGPVRYASRTYMANVLALVMQSRFGVGGAASRYGDCADQWTDTVYLGVIPRRVFETVGLYDEEIVQDEDTELNCRIRSRGGRVLLSGRLCTLYDNSPSVIRFARKHLAFGYWKARVWQKHRHEISWRHLVPPVFVLGILSGPPAAAAIPPAAPALVAVGIAYAAGAIAATLALGWRGGWRYVPVLPGVFFLLHVAWGAGFLAGAARFLPRWFERESAPAVLGTGGAVVAS